MDKDAEDKLYKFGKILDTIGYEKFTYWFDTFNQIVTIELKNTEQQFKINASNHTIEQMVSMLGSILQLGEL